jgi:hypothetical protein
MVVNSGIRESIFYSKERAYGALILALAIVFLKIYLISFFAKKLPFPAGPKCMAVRLHSAAVELPILALVVAFFFIMIRIGWNMLTTPPAKSLNQQELSLQEG